MSDQHQAITDGDLTDALIRLGALPGGARPRITALTGGVSSDIRLVEHDGQQLCVKRALPRLKVAQLWEAPITRNRFEWAWFEVVAAICPTAVPRLIAHDPAQGLFVMAFLAPDAHPLWKHQLRDGIAEPAFAAEVGARVARIHGATAGKAEIAARFPTDDSFHAIRLEPYLVATGRIHADLADRLDTLVQITASTKHTLVHGDVSPKNILIGAQGPIFLDAECAWYGDPAFDIAFCLNHLLLKCLWTPAASPGFLACFDALADRYLAGVSWETPAALEARAAHLLPGLLLARVDGKSPAEYVTEPAAKDHVRNVARRLLTQPVETLGAVRRAWAREIGAKEIGP